MRAEDLQVVLRPRGGLEAVDLGFEMARAWWKPLVQTWLALVLPIGLAIVGLLHGHPWWTIGLLWWLRPLFGRVSLHVLSRELLGARTRVRTTVAELPRVLLPGLFTTLVTLRLSPARAMLLPVVQLEGLRGPARRARTRLIGRSDTGAAAALLTVAAHIAGSVAVGIPLVLALLAPDELAWEVDTLLERGLDAEPESMASLLLPLLYLAGMSIAEPLIVAGGFGLYLNRRVFLEGWDIELAFRSLVARRGRAGHRGTAAAAALAALAAIGLVPTSVRAEGCDPALLESVPACIEEVLADPAFGSSETREIWTLREFDGPEVDATALGPLGELILQLLEVAAWVAFGIVVVALAVAIARRVEVPPANARPPPTAPPDRVFGLDVRESSLPDDLIGAARRAWAAGQVDEAIGLLYRGALARLIARHGLQIPESATERECIALVARERPGGAPATPEWFGELTGSWISARYAARAPSPEQFDTLCSGFARAFGGVA